MKNLKINPDDMTCHLPIKDMIELLEFKLNMLEIGSFTTSKNNDLIKELKEQINQLKAIF